MRFRSAVLTAILVFAGAAPAAGSAFASGEDASCAAPPETEATESALLPRLAQAAPAECIPRERCCKVCSKGKACGDSCIRRDYTCHKGRGCACNTAEICR